MRYAENERLLFSLSKILVFFICRVSFRITLLQHFLVSIQREPTAAIVILSENPKNCGPLILVPNRLLTHHQGSPSALLTNVFLGFSLSVTRNIGLSSPSTISMTYTFLEKSSPLYTRSNTDDDINIQLCSKTCSRTASASVKGLDVNTVIGPFVF